MADYDTIPEGDDNREYKAAAKAFEPPAKRPASQVKNGADLQNYLSVNGKELTEPYTAKYKIDSEGQAQYTCNWASVVNAWNLEEVAGILFNLQTDQSESEGYSATTVNYGQKAYIAV